MADKFRDELVKQMGETSATVEAYDVLQLYNRAASYGLEMEWFEWFIQGMRLGTDPVKAAEDACYEWDC